MTLSPKARRATAELQEAIRAGETQRVLSLVRSYGLSDGDRIAVACELDRPEIDYENAALRFDQWDGAHVRDLPKIWAQGLGR